MSTRPPESSAEEDADLEVTLEWGDFVATRAAARIEALLPSFLIHELVEELSDMISIGPALSSLFESCIQGKAPAETILPTNGEEHFFDEQAQPFHVLAMKVGAQLSLNEFTLTPELPNRDVPAEDELSRWTFGLIAAFLTGALATEERLAGPDREQCAEACAAGRRLLDSFLECASDHRATTASVSLQLHVLPRDEQMGVLSLEDRLTHWNAMMAFGAHIAAALDGPPLFESKPAEAELG
ncbi:MAG: hypothetical protein HOW73_41155 [Polyangiaceae bacterium]|nr:hypothetical protein [Polyangiaceae bacterium]